jgi:hypothetical protein
VTNTWCSLGWGCCCVHEPRPLVGSCSSGHTWALGELLGGRNELHGCTGSHRVARTLVGFCKCFWQARDGKRAVPAICSQSARPVWQVGLAEQEGWVGAEGQVQCPGSTPQRGGSGSLSPQRHHATRMVVVVAS